MFGSGRNSSMSRVVLIVFPIETKQRKIRGWVGVVKINDPECKSFLPTLWPATCQVRGRHLSKRGRCETASEPPTEKGRYHDASEHQQPDLGKPQFGHYKSQAYQVGGEEIG